MEGNANKEIVAELQKVLADTFILYFKTHSFHWNVEGPYFQQLHTMFEEQYNELWNATDEIAERIRSLDSYAPNTYASLIDIASLKETSQTPDASGMLSILESDNQAIVKTIYQALRVAEEAGDEATTDMMIERSQIHEKAAWMLRSSQKGS